MPETNSPAIDVAPLTEALAGFRSALESGSGVDASRTALVDAFTAYMSAVIYAGLAQVVAAGLTPNTDHAITAFPESDDDRLSFTCSSPSCEAGAGEFEDVPSLLYAAVAHGGITDSTALPFPDSLAEDDAELVELVQDALDEDAAVIIAELVEDFTAA